MSWILQHQAANVVPSEAQITIFIHRLLIVDHTDQDIDPANHINVQPKGRK